MSNKKTAIIIGAGPAGLTAAYELLEKTGIQPIVFEATNDIGGIAKTVNYKGNRIDIGGHRFFSKSDRVMDWWSNIMPLQGAPSKDELLLDITYQNQSRPVEMPEHGPDPEKIDRVMLLRQRLSRNFFLRKFFDYPVKLNKNTLTNLGAWRIVKIGSTYVWARIFPIKNEKSLEDFFINRFGKELYNTFFRDYTEKVWGMPANKIKAEWGAQRVKGVSVTEVIRHAVKSKFKKNRQGIDQKDVETSLIERFLYPKLGPGQMWEEVAKQVKQKGGTIHMRHQVVGIDNQDGQITAVTVRDAATGKQQTYKGDYFFSTMPIKDLIAAFENPVPEKVKHVAAGLTYRDFITVGLLLKKLKIKNHTNRKTINNIVPDNWIYIQEPDVRVGRLQIFNNWSPYMVRDLNTAWIGLEYFCNEGDDLWSKADDEFIKFAIDELVKIDIIDKNDVLDHTIIRVPKTYPGYFGTYDDLDVVKKYVSGIANLFLIGRNGMHKYNNQDHSMLTAMVAIENIINGVKSKDNIWAVNTEQDYHEQKE